MSSRSFRDGGCINHFTVPICDLKKDGVGHGRRFDQVNTPVEQILQPVQNRPK